MDDINIQRGTKKCVVISLKDKSIINDCSLTRLLSVNKLLLLQAHSQLLEATIPTIQSCVNVTFWHTTRTKIIAPAKSSMAEAWKQQISVSNISKMDNLLPLNPIKAHFQRSSFSPHTASKNRTSYQSSKLLFPLYGTHSIPLNVNGLQLANHNLMYLQEYHQGYHQGYHQ